MGEDNFNRMPMPLVDDENLEFSNKGLLSSANIDVPSSGSLDSFFDELLRDTHACTHAHSCNPPGPDLTHTHSCFHVHTKIVSPTSEEKIGTNDDSAESGGQKGSKRGREHGGNREAVRKYRQKKKAHTASLEDEVLKLKALNQKLLKKLQGEGGLEAEVARLKCLLVDIRGRIEGEIGSFPYQRPVNTGTTSFPDSYMVPCNGQCNDQIYCLRDGNAAVGGQGLNGCDFEKLNCLASLGSTPSYSCDTTNVTTTIGSSGNATRKS